MALEYTRTVTLFGTATGPGVPSILAFAGEPAFTVIETVPENTIYQLHSVAALLVTEAGDGDRRPFLLLDDGTDPLLQFYLKDFVQAAETAELFWMKNFPNEVFNRKYFAPLGDPPLLLPGHRIILGGTDLVAGDRYHEARYMITSWLTA